MKIFPVPGTHRYPKFQNFDGYRPVPWYPWAVPNSQNFPGTRYPAVPKFSKFRWLPAGTLVPIPAIPLLTKGPYSTGPVPRRPVTRMKLMINQNFTQETLYFGTWNNFRPQRHGCPWLRVNGSSAKSERRRCRFRQVQQRSNYNYLFSLFWPRKL